MSIAPLRFSGISTFSQDFQTILERTVSIASLPAKQLEAYQQEILADKTALGAVSRSVSSLAGSLRSLASLKSGGALTVSSSSSKVTATKTAGASPGVYVLSEITSLAQSSVYTAVHGMPDTAATPVDPDGEFALFINGAEHRLTLGEGENSLSGLRDAINAAALGLTAAIVDSGSGPNRFFLTLTANEPGARTFELRTEAADPGSNLLAVTRAGSDAQFKLNGISIASSDNRIRGAIQGVDFTLNATTSPSEIIELTVKSDRAPVISALSGFVTAYNDLASTLALHRGDAGGSLSGSSIVLDLARQMMALNGLSGDGPAANLAALGITLNREGVMSLDSSVLSGMNAAAFHQALDFLASPTSGFASMVNAFEQFSDPVSGAIQTEIGYLNEANQRYSSQMEAITGRVSLMQAALLAKLQAADSVLAALESKRSLLDAVVESLNTVTNGKRKA